MTRDEIEKLSDEELNVMVATEVMGWTPADVMLFDGHYSTDIAAAWQVAEKMRDDGYNISINYSHLYGVWVVDFLLKKERHTSKGRTLPRAISIASMLARMQP